jgi:hypothetical protein
VDRYSPGFVAASRSQRNTLCLVLTWDDQRVYETFDGMGSYVDWNRLVRVAETADHLYLLRGEADPIIVPKRAGSVVAQLAAEARWRVPQAGSRADARLNPAVQGERPGREEESVDRPASGALRSVACLA